MVMMVMTMVVTSGDTIMGCGHDPYDDDDGDDDDDDNDDDDDDDEEEEEEEEEEDCSNKQN